MAARVFKVEFRIAVAQRILNGESGPLGDTSSTDLGSLSYRVRRGKRAQGLLLLELRHGSASLRNHSRWFTPRRWFRGALGFKLPGA